MKENLEVHKKNDDFQDNISNLLNLSLLAMSSYKTLPI